MLINCVAYQEGKKLSDIPVEDISEYVVRPDTFVWVALRDADTAELVKMQEEFSLHELAVEDAMRGNQRPKIEEYGDSLFVVAQTVELVGDELTIGEVDIFVGENYVLSSRRNVTQGFLGVRARAEREPHLLVKGSCCTRCSTPWWTVTSPSSTCSNRNSKRSRNASSFPVRSARISNTCMSSNAR